jgi:lipoprotein NlpD
MRAVRGAAFLAALLLGACTSAPRRFPPPPPAAARAAPVAVPAEGYVVRAGDTLYSISFRHGLDYHDVARWNGIGADYRIDIGQRLRLAAPDAGSAGARPADVPLPVTAPPHWSWPADGRAMAVSGPPSNAVALRILGEAGAPVRAAAAGRVVYTGAGLRAYGQLVIVKHDETWLTAYGYNRELNVAEGDVVREGQPIATMGTGPGQQPALYFEIRRNGRPVDPLQQLPAR